MLKITNDGSGLSFGPHCTIHFVRTLRLPDDGKTYPLPPGLGNFPITSIADYADKVPEDWRKQGGFFIPMYQREALWLSFVGHDWHPVALKVGVGQINALTGKQWDQQLHEKPQDYLVCPTQPWLDGIMSGAGVIRQFVAMPLGAGYTVEEQLRSDTPQGGLQIIVFEAKRGKFPETNPEPPGLRRRGLSVQPMSASPAMGLGAGGQMTQAIYPDPHGVKTWDQKNVGTVTIRIVNSEQYEQITGMKPPPTPVDAQEYTAHGYPWYEIYDEAKGRLAPTEQLQGVQSVQQIGRQRNDTSVAADPGFEVPREQIRPPKPARKTGSRPPE